VIINRKSLRDSRHWIVVSLLATLVCTAWYFFHYRHTIHGAKGGTVTGLVFGSIGTAFILFAFGITVRRRFRSMRWGRAYWWLQGHIYLSLVSYWIILLHAGFTWGGPLTQVLMWAFTVCYVSGIFVLILQQMIPRLLLAEVTRETIYDQIDAVALKNLKAADALVAANAVVAVTVPDLDSAGAEGDAGDDDGGFATVGGRTSPGADLKAFYDRRVRPYLASGIRPADQGVVGAWFAGIGRALSFGGAPRGPDGADFNDLRRKMPDELYGAIDALEGYTEERRQFALQKRMHHWLHGWLLLHVPTAWIMTVLLIVHAVMAVSYL
jgi:hypothetical protein